MDTQKFFVCKHCGNLVGMVLNHGVPLVCCGEKMTELVPNTIEANREKHLPVCEMSDNTLTVSVGSAAHPTEEAHHITFIYVETEHGGQRQTLGPSTAPTATFAFNDDKPVAVYAYCNIHGLWKVTI